MIFQDLQNNLPLNYSVFYSPVDLFFTEGISSVGRDWAKLNVFKETTYTQAKKILLFVIYPAKPVVVIHKHIWATSWENLFMQYANNKGADQPAHPRSLISTFVVRCLDSIVSSCYIWNFKTLASLCLWADWFESNLVANLEDRLSPDAHMRTMLKYLLTVFQHSSITKQHWLQWVFSWVFTW